MDTDRNLLFGVLALQADLLDPDRFAEACAAWAVRKDTPLADLLVERDWLTPADRADVERLLERKLKKHHGDARASLAEVRSDRIARSLTTVTDPGLRASLAGITTPPAPGPVQLSTSLPVPEARGRYTLTRLHATGGIGRVWLAHDASLGRDVALKELLPERRGDPALARFFKEAQITGQLEHPGIVPIYELGSRTDDDNPYYTMRFVRGRTLADAVAAYHRRRAQGEAGPLELRELLSAFVGICNAVAYAHSRGVLHRDLKPQNVVLGDYGEVMVLDWGLARLLNQAESEDLVPVQVPSAAGATVQGQVLGTPAYMAPEQAEGRLDRLGPASDTYGLGAILYEILTGRAPFSGSELAAVMCQVVLDPPARPRLVSAAAPAALEAVCLKALAKKPEERYGSARELADEVRRWLADEPVRAYREPWIVRAGRWARRNRVMVTSAAAAGLVALVALVVVLVLQARANRDLQAANEREHERFALALEAIQTFHTGVSEDVLLTQDQFQELRNKLLGAAAAFYARLEKLLEGQGDMRSRQALGQAYYHLGELTEKIGSQADALNVHRQSLAVRRVRAGEPGADTEARLDVARSLLAVGRLQQASGDSSGALASFDEARELAEALAASGQPTDAVRGMCAQCYRQAGIVHEATGQPEAAREAYRKALAIWQELADAHPRDPALQSDLAHSHNDLGILLGLLGQPEAERAEYQKALAIRQKLVASSPDDIDFRHNLAWSHHNLGTVLNKAGQPVAALASYREARALWQRLADAHPAVNAFQVPLARCQNNIAEELDKLGQPEAALAAYRKALDIRQKLVDGNRTVTAYQSELAHAHYNLGDLLEKLGQAEAALTEHQQAREIRQRLTDAHPTVPQFQGDLADSLSFLGSAHRRRGRAAEAVACYRRSIHIRERLAVLDPNDLYNLACSQALLAGVAADPASGLKPADGQAAADQAMATLRRAVAAGYHDLPGMRTDTDLGALRARPDFQKLMQELEAKVKER
jgi:serine/threonine-protein kinase